MYRYRKTKNSYNARTDEVCPFCQPLPAVILQETKTAYVLKSNFPYDLWEFRDVQDHLLLAPKRHIKSLAMFTKAEQAEMMRLIAAYEAQDYNVYIKSIHSVKKTMPEHQHTHLVKTTNKRAKLAIFVEKPYFLFKR